MKSVLFFRYLKFLIFNRKFNTSTLCSRGNLNKDRTSNCLSHFAVIVSNIMVFSACTITSSSLVQVLSVCFTLYMYTPASFLTSYRNLSKMNSLPHPSWPPLPPPDFQKFKKNCPAMEFDWVWFAVRGSRWCLPHGLASTESVRKQRYDRFQKRLGASIVNLL